MDFAKSFLIAIKYNVDNSGIDASSNKIGQLDSKISRLSAGALTSGAFLIDNMIGGATSRYNDLFLTFKTGFDDIQQYIQAGNITVGTNGKAVGQELVALGRQINDIKKLGGGIPIEFDILGINMNQSSTGIIDSLAKSFQSLDGDKGTALASRLGLDNFYQSLESLGKGYSLLPPIKYEELTRIREASQSLNMLKNTMLLLKDKALAELSPFLNDKMLSFFTWIKNNESSILYFMTSFTKALINIGSVLGHVIGFVAEISSMQFGVLGLSAAFAGLFYLFNRRTAIFSAILLAIEDVFVYLKGGESVLGSFIDKFGTIGKVIFGLGAGVLVISKLTMAFSLLAGTLTTIKTILMSIFPMFTAVIAGAAALKFLDNEFDITGKLSESFKDLQQMDLKAKLFGEDTGKMNEMKKSTLPSITPISESVKNFFNNVSNNSESNKQTTQNFHININGSQNDSPADFVRKIQEEVQKQMKNNNMNFGY